MIYHTILCGLNLIMTSYRAGDLFLVSRKLVLKFLEECREPRRIIGRHLAGDTWGRLQVTNDQTPIITFGPILNAFLSF